MSELHEAVISSNLKRVHELLERDSSIVNDWDLNGYTPLHLVYDNVDLSRPKAADERLPIIQTLIDYGADVNAVNLIDETPLHTAIRKSQFNGAKMLLENQADPNARTCSAQTALTTIYLTTTYLKSSSTDYFNLLLKFNAELNTVNCMYNTALEISIRPFQSDYAMLLLRAGGKVFNVYNELLEAINFNHMKSVNFISQHGVEIDLHGQFKFENILFYIKYGFQYVYYDCLDDDRIQREICKVLIDKHINILKIQDKENKSLLHYAAEKLDETHVLLLLEAGANVNDIDRCGNTPLHLVLACSEESDKKMIDKISEMLIQQGADISLKNCFGCRPFHLAVKNFHLNVVNLILFKMTGIDEIELSTMEKLRELLLKNNEDNYLNFFLDEISVAIILGYEKVVDRLLDSYMIFNTDKNFFKAPNGYMNHAVSGDHVKIVQILIEFGYDECFYCQECSYKNSYVVSLKIVCLLWELHCLSALKYFFFDTIKHTVHNPNYNSDLHGRRQNLEILYYAIKLRTNRLDKALLPVSGIFKLNKDLSSILEDCNKILDELIKEQVCESFTKYDIITMEFSALVICLNNSNILLACEQLCSSLKNKESLENHEVIIIERIFLALERKKCYDSARDFLNQIFESSLQKSKYSSLPDELMTNILQHLSIRELKKIEKSQRE